MPFLRMYVRREAATCQSPMLTADGRARYGSAVTEPLEIGVMYRCEFTIDDETGRSTASATPVTARDDPPSCDLGDG